MRNELEKSGKAATAGPPAQASGPRSWGSDKEKLMSEPTSDAQDLSLRCPWEGTSRRSAAGLSSTSGHCEALARNSLKLLFLVCITRLRRVRAR